MYLVVIAWLYVTLMMAVAEATSPVGSVLGAIVTFVLYGLLPLSILVYILGTPGRKRKLRRRAEAEQLAWTAAQTPGAPAAGPPAAGAPAAGPPVASINAGVTPDAGGEASAAAQARSVPPVREEH